MAGSADTRPADRGPAAAGPPPKRKRKRTGRAIFDLVITVLVAVLAAGLLRAFAFQTFWIPTGSMIPALDIHDRILVQKAFFSWHDLHQGDIVVFRHPPLDRCGGTQDDAASSDLVKRVIALPGQTIYSAGNHIYVNGKLLPEPYLPRPDPLGLPIPDATKQHPFRVPAGDFYMLGDNRAISCDSRYWGPIKGSSIVGKVVLVWWHDGRPDFRWF